MVRFLKKALLVHKFRNYKLKTRLMCYFLLIISIPLMGIGYFTYFFVERVIEENTGQNVKQTLVQANNTIEYYLRDLLNVAAVLNVNDQLVNMLKREDELVKIGQQVTNKEKGIYGFGFWGSKHYGSCELVIGPYTWDRGGSICDKDGVATFNSPQAMEAIQFLSDCVHKYKISPESVFTADFTEIDNAFQAGNIAMIINGTYQSPTYFAKAQFAKDGNIGWAPIPGKEGPSPNFANGWALGIPAKAKNVKGAWEFIKFFETPEVQLEHSKIEGGAPTRKSAWSDETFKDDMHKFFFDNLDKNGHPMDPLVYYQEGLEALNLAALGYFLDPAADLKKLLDDSATAFNKKFYNK